jgi:hypothetical protein
LSIPSLQSRWNDRKESPGKVRILEIHDRLRPEEDPIARLVFEVTERDRDEGHLMHESQIEVHYERIDTAGGFGSAGWFAANYCRRLNEVSLTSGLIYSDGAVYLDLSGLEGQNIGTYVMNEIVKWAQRWPDAQVKCIELRPSEGNYSRALGLFRRFGIQFDYDDDRRISGRSRPIAVRDLNVVDVWKKNIREVNVLDTLRKLLGREDLLERRRRLDVEKALREWAHQQAVAREAQDLLERRQHPVLWVLKQGVQWIDGR